MNSPDPIPPAPRPGVPGDSGPGDSATGARAAWALALSAIAIVAAGWLGRGVSGNWGWGIRTWAYLPSWWTPAAAALGLLAPAAGLIAARRRGAPAAPAEAAVPAGLVGALLLCLAFRALLGLAPERIHFLGDTQLRTDVVARISAGRPAGPLMRRIHAAPLDALAVRSAAELARARVLGAASAARLPSSAAELLYSLAAVWAAWGLARTGGARLLALALLFTQGYVQLFAGYAEAYGLQAALLLGWAAAVISERDGPDRVPWSFPLAGLAALAHPSSLVLLPAQAVHALSRPPGSRQGSRDRWWLAGWGLFAACMAVLAVAWLPQLRSQNPALFTSGLRMNGASGDGFFSAVHAANILNELFLLAPAATALLLLCAAGVRGARAAPALWIAGAGFAAMLVLVRTDATGLGAIRDWDAYAPVGVFAALLAARALARAVDREPRLAPTGWGLVLACGLSSGAWLALNASEAPALRRAHDVVESTPSLPMQPQILALDALARIHQLKGEPAEAAALYERAAGLAPNARFLWAAGLNAYAAGQVDRAGGLLRRAAGQDASYRRELMAENAAALARDPENPLFRIIRRVVAEADSAASRAGGVARGGGSD